MQVVYINTSLRTKALAHAQVPTITCTSSNVVQTVLQAFAQVRYAGLCPCWACWACLGVCTTKKCWQWGGGATLYISACQAEMRILSPGLAMPRATSPTAAVCAQVPDVNVWYGPDTYMGRNLAQLFASLAQLSDEEVKELHPQHTQVGSGAGEGWVCPEGERALGSGQP